MDPQRVAERATTRDKRHHVECSNYRNYRHDRSFNGIDVFAKQSSSLLYRLRVRRMDIESLRLPID